MKRTKTRLACLLCLATLLLLLLASCATPQSDEAVPEGMLSATCVGANYRLYVPTHWTVNTAYGVSGAYRSFNQQSTVSVNTYPITDQMKADMQAAGIHAEEASARIQWFAEAYCQAAVRARALNGEITLVPEECIPSELGGLNAYRCRYSAIINKQPQETLHFLQHVAEKGDCFYVFTFTATEEMFKSAEADVNRILDFFAFNDIPYKPFDYAKKFNPDVAAPEGMQLASGDDVAYRFFVPADWRIDMDQSIYAAYVEGDRTSVSVVPYSPKVDGLKVNEYFTMTKDLLNNLSPDGNFEMLSDEANPQKISLAGSKNQAWIYEYRIKIGGETYHYRQYIVAYRSMIYSITYTATEQAYATHLGELDAIIAAFSFR